MQTKKNNTGFWIGFGPERIRNHLGLTLFSLAGCGVAFLYEHTALLTDIIALGTAYVALILLVVTLSIGPLNLMLKRRNAVNLDLRRDVGIWAGITGCVHAFFSFQLYNKADILSYFFNKQGNRYSLQFNLFSFSNITGTLATLVLLALLFLSNNLSLRWLKGKSWKFVQRFNYTLFILVIAHTVGYQVLNQRESFFTFLIIGLVIFTVEAQVIGVLLTLRRDRQREAAAKTGQGPGRTMEGLSGKELEQNIVARRRFLLLSGVTIITGVSSIMALSLGIAEQNKTNAAVQNSGNATTNPVNTSGSASVDNSSSSGASDNSGTLPAAAANNSGGGGPVLASLSSLPAGACTTFTTPDSGETAFLIHEQDGSVKAFSNICTHRPYELSYEQNQQAFYCPLHGATFDINSGQVTGGPARYGLQSYKVQVDSQGKVIYINS